MVPTTIYHINIQLSIQAIERFCLMCGESNMPFRYDWRESMRYMCIEIIVIKEDSNNDSIIVEMKRGKVQNFEYPRVKQPHYRHSRIEKLSCR